MEGVKRQSTWDYLHAGEEYLMEGKGWTYRYNGGKMAKLKEEKEDGIGIGQSCGWTQVELSWWESRESWVADHLLTCILDVESVASTDIEVGEQVLERGLRMKV